MFIGPSPSFSFFGKTSISKGYSVSICVKCEITPSSLLPIYFTNDVIKIAQNEVDCSSSLADANFTNPNNLMYSRVIPVV